MRITDVLLTDRKWFWKLFRYLFADFGPIIVIWVILPVLTVLSSSLKPLRLHTAFLFCRRIYFCNHFCKYHMDKPVSPVERFGSGTKKQAKEEVFGPNFPLTSGQHSDFGRTSRVKTSGRASTSSKNKHFSAHVHDPEGCRPPLNARRAGPRKTSEVKKDSQS